jgi:hypothetical protein
LSCIEEYQTKKFIEVLKFSCWNISGVGLVKVSGISYHEKVLSPLQCGVVEPAGKTHI